MSIPTIRFAYKIRVISHEKHFQICQRSVNVRNEKKNTCNCFDNWHTIRAHAHTAATVIVGALLHLPLQLFLCSLLRSDKIYIHRSLNENSMNLNVTNWITFYVPCAVRFFRSCSSIMLLTWLQQLYTLCCGWNSEHVRLQIQTISSIDGFFLSHTYSLGAYLTCEKSWF